MNTSSPALYERHLEIIRKTSKVGVRIAFSEISEEDNRYKATRYHAFRIVKPTLNMGIWDEKTIMRKGTGGGFKKILLKRRAWGMYLICVRSTFSVKENKNRRTQ